MSNRIKDLSGKRFSRLVVSKLSHQGKNKAAFWHCLCDCGNASIVESSNLLRGKTKSCGCLHREISKNRLLKHGGRWTPEYRSYMAMLYRCTNSKAANFRFYGGRGIEVCSRWLTSFSNFIQDMGPRPKGTELDRINTMKGYSPENCRWTDHRTNTQNNRRSSKYVHARTMPIMASAMN